MPGHTWPLRPSHMLFRQLFLILVPKRKLLLAHRLSAIGHSSLESAVVLAVARLALAAPLMQLFELVRAFYTSK